MSMIATNPLTYNSIGMNGQSDMERTMREKIVVIPTGDHDIIREEFIQNVIRYKPKGSQFREDVPPIVIYLSSSRIKDEEGIIMDTLRGLSSPILITASVGKGDEVRIELPGDMVKGSLHLYIKNGHILTDDKDNKDMFHGLVIRYCEPGRDWRENKKNIFFVICFVVVVIVVIVIVSLILHFATEE